MRAVHCPAGDISGPPSHVTARPWAPWILRYGFPPSIDGQDLRFRSNRGKQLRVLERHKTPPERAQNPFFTVHSDSSGALIPGRTLRHRSHLLLVLRTCIEPAIMSARWVWPCPFDDAAGFELNLTASSVAAGHRLSAG